jgi:hypothetical protein
VVSSSSRIPDMQKRTFRAWLSSSAASASTRLVHGTGKNILPRAPDDGTAVLVVANDWTALVRATLRHAFDRDEKGESLVGSARVWTGTDSSGLATGTDCDGWRSLDRGFEGRTGQSDGTDAIWTDNASSARAQQAHLYCVED